jgi:hypothetical protein
MTETTHPPTETTRQPTETTHQPSETAYQPCEECGAPLDSQQRYCVNCAARRGNGSNPASRYFATMSKRARRPTARAPEKSPTSRAAAVGFFALLPIAVALGVVVGRSGSSNNDQALLEALHRQDAAVANTSAGPSTTASANKSKAKSKNASGVSTKGHSKILANTPNGPIHQAIGYQPTKHEAKKDNELVKQTAKDVGKGYAKQEQNLPDVVVVGGK